MWLVSMLKRHWIHIFENTNPLMFPLCTYQLSRGYDIDIYPRFPGRLHSQSINFSLVSILAVTVAITLILHPLQFVIEWIKGNRKSAMCSVKFKLHLIELFRIGRYSKSRIFWHVKRFSIVVESELGINHLLTCWTNEVWVSTKSGHLSHSHNTVCWFLYFV